MAEPLPYRIRRDADRGRFSNDWLDARFSFSFGDWNDPDWPRFGPLLALNEDRVQPRRGFAMHGHRNLEIVMLPRRGRIEHRDDAGGHAIVAPGEVQVMHAGRGIRHSQHNPSDETDHHFQIWLAPRRRDASPGAVTQRLAPPRRGEWVVVASGHGRGGASIDADADLLWGRAEPDTPLALHALPGRSRYLHLMDGSASFAGQRLSRGDAVVWPDAADPVLLHAEGTAELLCFELPSHP